MIKVITYLKTRYLKKGSFAVNVATLSTGTVISQIIVVAVSPLLTRLYSSSDFGVYALYLAIASVVTVIATGRYELAIVLPKADEDAAHLILLSLIINFCVCFLFFFNSVHVSRSYCNAIRKPDDLVLAIFCPTRHFFNGDISGF